MKDTRRGNKENTTDYCGGQRVRTLQQTVAAVDVGYGYGGWDEVMTNSMSNPKLPLNFSAVFRT